MLRAAARFGVTPDEIRERMSLRDLCLFDLWEAENPPADWWLRQIAGWMGIQLKKKLEPEEEAAAWDSWMRKVKGQ